MKTARRRRWKIVLKILEDALDDLKAEFEKMMGDDGEEGDMDMDAGEEEPDGHGHGFEDDEEVDEASEEEAMKLR